MVLTLCEEANDEPFFDMGPSLVYDLATDQIRAAMFSGMLRSLNLNSEIEDSSSPPRARRRPRPRKAR
jgi:hypothetical protein